MNSLFDSNYKANISTPIYARKQNYSYDKEQDITIDMCLSCTEESCSGSCLKLKCCDCKHRIKTGNNGEVICGVINKEIHKSSFCPNAKRSRRK